MTTNFMEKQSELAVCYLILQIASKLMYFFWLSKVFLLLYIAFEYIMYIDGVVVNRGNLLCTTYVKPGRKRCTVGGKWWGG